MAFEPEAALAAGAVPNPFEGKLLMLVTAHAAQAASLTLFDALGRPVRTGVLAVAGGANRLPVTGLAGLPAGTCFGQLLLDGRLHYFKAVKE